MGAVVFRQIEPGAWGFRAVAVVQLFDSVGGVAREIRMATNGVANREEAEREAVRLESEVRAVGKVVGWLT